MLSELQRKLNFCSIFLSELLLEHICFPFWGLGITVVINFFPLQLKSAGFRHRRPGFQFLPITCVLLWTTHSTILGFSFLIYKRWYYTRLLLKITSSSHPHIKLIGSVSLSGMFGTRGHYVLDSQKYIWWTRHMVTWRITFEVCRSCILQSWDQRFRPRGDLESNHILLLPSFIL